MSCISGLLIAICPEIEQYLKPNLRGVQGLVLLSFLPQVWVFETEHCTSSLIVDREGDTSVQIGGRVDRDVTIKWKHDSLASVLKTRSSSSVPHGERPTIMLHSGKGRAAFDFLRRRFGL